MQIRDRIKQTGTATSGTAITMSGVAADKRLTFEQGFQMPTVAQVAGTLTWSDVPLEIERADGSWGVVLGTVTRSGAGAVTVSFDVNDIIASSAFNTTTRVFDSFGLVATDVVTVAVTPSAGSLGGAVYKPRGRITTYDSASNPGPFRTADALFAVGNNAHAGSPFGESGCIGSSAIGDDAGVGLNRDVFGGHAWGQGAKAGDTLGDGITGPYAIGYGALVEYDFSLGIAGLNSTPSLPFQRATSRAVGFPVGSMEVYQHDRDGVGLLGSTTDATPFKLRCYDENNVAIPGTEDGPFVDVGATVITATVMAFEPATGDRKVWRVEWIATSDASYTTTSILGTPTVTVLYESGPGAGSTSTWDVDPFVDSTPNSTGLQVTGQAAKTIAWSAMYRSDVHECWAP